MTCGKIRGIINHLDNSLLGMKRRSTQNINFQKNKMKFASSNYNIERLKVMSYIEEKQASYDNFIIPVLPGFLIDSNQSEKANCQNQSQ